MHRYTVGSAPTQRLKLVTETVVLGDKSRTITFLRTSEIGTEFEAKELSELLTNALPQLTEMFHGSFTITQLAPSTLFA